MTIKIKHLGLQDYQTTWENMKQFTLERIQEKKELHEKAPLLSDEIWMVQHPPVYTQGQAGKPEHILYASDIPIIQTDRGGQITYHGPGQLVAYVLLDLKKYELNVRDLVCLQERAVITLLKQYSIEANGSRESPGIYVDGQKIASIGLRIKQGYSYHGLALNVDMDLCPFQAIRPCGLFNMQMTQMKLHYPEVEFSQVERELVDILKEMLSNAVRDSKALCKGK